MTMARAALHYIPSGAFSVRQAAATAENPNPPEVVYLDDTEAPVSDAMQQAIEAKCAELLAADEAETETAMTIEEAQQKIAGLTEEIQSLKSFVGVEENDEEPA